MTECNGQETFFGWRPIRFFGIQVEQTKAKDIRYPQMISTFFDCCREETNDEYLRNAINDLRIHTATPFHQNDATPERRHLKNFSVIFHPTCHFGAGSGYSTEDVPHPKKVVERPRPRDGVFGSSEGNKLLLSFPLILTSLAAPTMAFVSEESKCQASWAQLDGSRLRFQRLQFSFDFTRPETASRYFSAGRIESGSEEGPYVKNIFMAGV
jgi:hypothetical protein